MIKDDGQEKKKKEEGSKKSSFDPTGVKVCSFYGEKVCECSYCETRSEVRDRKRTSSATIKQNSLFIKWRLTGKDEEFKITRGRLKRREPFRTPGLKEQSVRM